MAFGVIKISALFDRTILPNAITDLSAYRVDESNYDDGDDDDYDIRSKQQRRDYIYGF